MRSSACGCLAPFKALEGIFIVLMWALLLRGGTRQVTGILRGVSQPLCLQYARSAHTVQELGPSAKQILADLCKALSDSQDSFHPSTSEVEALPGNDWRQPLHVTVRGSSPQRFELEARHFRDLTTESYVTDCAQIVVYHWWAAQTALSADWVTMGVA